MKKFEVGQWAILAPVSWKRQQFIFREVDAMPVDRPLIQQADSGRKCRCNVARCG